MKELINREAVELSDILIDNCQYPGIAKGRDGSLYIAWQRYRDRRDDLICGWLESGELVEQTVVSGGGLVLRPVLCASGDRIWLVWSECVDRMWSICARSLEKGKYSDILTIDKSEANFYPAACDLDGTLAVVWTRQGPDHSETVFATVEDGKASASQVLSQRQKTYRPSLCKGGDGNLYLVYDSFNGESYDVVCRMRQGGDWSDEMVVSTSKTEWAASPVVAATKTGATLCWYDFGPRSAFSYQYADLTAAGGKPTVTGAGCIAKGTQWYHDIALASDENGTLAFAYNWGKNDAHVRVRKAGEGWSAPVTMTYDNGDFASHPKLLLEGGNVHLVWQFGQKNGHKPHRNASVVYNRLTLAEMGKYADADSESKIEQFSQPIPAAKSLDQLPTETVRAWLDRNGYNNLALKWGDIHGQSGMSDGVGEIDQYYHSARVWADLDFTALTDHDCYPDWLSQSEWEWIRTTNRLFNRDGELSCLLAYEWTPNEYRYDFGHKNIYYRDDEGEIFRSGDEGGMTPDRLFESLKQYKAMAFPHHPAATWTMVSAATDWNFHDEEIQRLVEIFSRHAPFEYYGNESAYTKNNPQLENCSVQDALARGYHMGIIAGSDSHQMEHGVEGGIFAAFVPALTRENVYDAMYDRFVYGTSGARILVSLKADGLPMGRIIQAKPEQKVSLEVSVLGTDKVCVELLKNNRVIHTQRPDSCECGFTVEDAERGESDYYYVRVTQDDRHQAWSSPIWVELA